MKIDLTRSRPQKFILFVFLLATPLALTSCGPAKKAPAPSSRPTLPSHWYLLPEQAPPGTPLSMTVVGPNPIAASASRGQLPAVGQSLQTMVESNQLLLEGLEKKSRRRHRKWQLSEFRTALAVGISGGVGILTLKGSGAVRLDWERVVPKITPPAATLKRELQPQAATPTIQISSSSDPDAIERQVADVAKLTSLAMEVEDGQKLQKNLNKTVKRFRYLARALEMEAYRGTRWFPAGLRLDVSFDASGQVVQMASVGAQVRIRMEYFRLTPSENSLSNLGTTGEAEDNQLIAGQDRSLKKNLQAFIYNLTRDLCRSDGEVYSSHRFTLDRMFFGLGLSLSGDVGVAKLKGSSVAFVLFRRRAQAPKKWRDRPQDRHLLSSTLNIKKGRKQLDFARTHNIPYQVLDEGVIYKASRKVFHRGLKRMYKMTQFFLSNIDKLEKKSSARGRPRKWRLRQIENIYALSITGSIGVVSLSGSANVQLNFRHNR